MLTKSKALLWMCSKPGTSVQHREKLTMLLVPLSRPPCAVIAVIAATLFPLWPAEMRVGVYYLSVGAGCFVASILLLAVGECGRAGSEGAEAQPGPSPSSELGGATSRDLVQPQPGGSCARFPPASGCHSCAAGRESSGSVTCWCFLCSAHSFTASV